MQYYCLAFFLIGRSCGFDANGVDALAKVPELESAGTISKPGAQVLVILTEKCNPYRFDRLTARVADTSDDGKPGLNWNQSKNEAKQ